MNKTLVIDCNNICYSSFHIFKELSYNEKKTGVIFGFLYQLLNIANKFETNKVIFCWDSKKRKRSLIYPPYKANRRKDLTPEEKRDMKLAFEQFTELRTKTLPELGFSNIYHKTGYEADDLIAYIVSNFKGKFVVISTDKDLYQLLDRCDIYNQVTKKTITEESFKKKYDIEVYQWVDVKSLVGDKSDNVEGIERVGEITAIKFIKGELNKGKVWDNVVSEKGQRTIARNIRLMLLPFYKSNGIKLELKEDDLNKDKFISTFVDYGFNSFAKKKMLKKWELFYV